MPIAIDPRCIQRVKEALVPLLESTTVDHNVSLSGNLIRGLFECDKILPQQGEVRDQLTQFIGEQPLFHLVYQTLSRELAENETFALDVLNRPLVDLPAYASLEGTADRLLRELIQLPRNYVISVQLPSAMDPVLGELPRFEFCNGVCFARVDQDLQREYPLAAPIPQRDNELFGGQGLFGLFRGRPARLWRPGGTVFQARVEGFVGRYGSTAPIEAAVRQLKSVVGLMIGTRILQVDATTNVAPPPGRQVADYLCVHEVIGDLAQLHSTRPLSDTFENGLERLAIDDLDGKLLAAHVAPRCAREFEVIRAAFRAGQRAHHVMRGARWLLDSHSGANELLSFIQATVAIEIMLGEEKQSDVLSIGEMLSNRCAYSVGKSRRQRDSILKDFREIYDVRSKIVHTGKEHLTTEDRMSMDRLQWLCGRVIQEELSLLVQDEERPQRV